MCTPTENIIVSECGYPKKGCNNKQASGYHDVIAFLVSISG